MRLFALALACIGFALQSCSEPESRFIDERVLSFEQLMNGNQFVEPLRLVEFTPTSDSRPASNRFSGRLRLETAAQSNNVKILVDELDLVVPDRPGFAELPPFDFAFVQDSDLLVPARQGPIVSQHEWWDFVLRPGRVWDEEGDKGFSRAAIPFALKERREDCIHNGLMSFLFDNGGRVSNVAFQISNQTCRYLKFEMRGLLRASYSPGQVAEGAVATALVSANRASRLPQRPISQLQDDFVGAKSDQFGSIEEIDPKDMTVYGFVIDGIHYVGGCDSSYGKYPYCNDMALPSYSTAKSLVGGLGLMLMERAYPGTANAQLSDYVPECGDDWRGVTVENALDMTTGHYNSSAMHADEDSAINSRFFLHNDHATKIDFACNEYPRKSDPGEHVVYHTSTTYLAGTAMNNRLKSIIGADADFFRDILVEKVWKPLRLSQLAQATRRTDDAVAQPFTGFGLTLLRDDVAKLAQFIGVDDGVINGLEVLDERLFDAIKQRIADDPGMQAEIEYIRYNNGFRSFDVSSYLGCENPTWLVVLSGFGGIIVAIMPNETAYYYFSDGNVHRYLHAVRESHSIRSMCQ